MSVSVSDVNALVSYTVCDCNRLIALIYQKRNIRVSQIVNADMLYACGFRTSVHLVIKVAFRYRKDTVYLFETVEYTEIFLHFLAEKMRHFNGAVAFLCFR